MGEHAGWLEGGDVNALEERGGKRAGAGRLSGRFMPRPHMPLYTAVSGSASCSSSELERPPSQLRAAVSLDNEIDKGNVKHREGGSGPSRWEGKGAKSAWMCCSTTSASPCKQQAAACCQLPACTGRGSPGRRGRRAGGQAAVAHPRASAGQPDSPLTTSMSSLPLMPSPRLAARL